MAEKDENGEDTAPYDFIAQIKAQSRLTVPKETRELKDYEAGDYVRVKLWLHKKGVKNK